MGKKIPVPCLDVIMIAFFPRNIQWKTIFLILNYKKAIIITSKHSTRIFSLMRDFFILLQGFVWETYVSDMKIVHKIRSERF